MAWFQNFNLFGGYQKMTSVLLYLLLLVVGLITMWLRKELLTWILIQIDGVYLPVISVPYPFFNRGRTIIDWAKQRLPRQWSSHLDTLSGGLVDFWQDGSLLCTLINSAIPGACSNPYRHWNQPPNHAQEVAFKYLGIAPVFKDFPSPLTPTLKNRFLNYLSVVYKSINVLERERLLYRLTTPKFLARGMGLYTAEQYKEAEFFIYSTQDLVSLFNVEVCFTGPFSSRFKTTVLELLTKQRKSSNNSFKVESKTKKIKLQIEVQKDRVKVVYIANFCGIHEISLSHDHESVMGSPFFVNVVNYARISLENRQTSLPLKAISKPLLNSFWQTQDLPVSITPKSWTIYFAEQHYSCFQKFANSCFRTPCNITRASPVFSQSNSASPVCRRHIVPEDKIIGKLPAKIRRKASHFKKSCSYDSSVSSSSENSNEVDAEILSKRRNYWVEKKKQFWESVFNEDWNETRNCPPAVASRNTRLKHVDSLYLLRKRPVSKSLSDLRKSEIQHEDLVKPHQARLLHINDPRTLPEPSDDDSVA
ncbi:uncharacterized protein [Euwallacea fornicatus]|uniref:uncharacterized protein isoform X2 n=1 Tax=Euwallacea fornicatus TaxID=995702 RepID=UPI00338D63B9